MSGVKAAREKKLNPEKIQAFHAQVMNDVAGLSAVACGSIGDRIGLYRVMAESGPITSAELAQAAGATERYVREWLVNQAASGYIEYDPASAKFTLPLEHAAVLADEESPYFAAGVLQAFAAFVHAVPRIGECFKSGQGMLWGEHHPEVFVGTERLFRPIYTGQLVTAFIPAVPGLKDRMESGIKVADIGCGSGVSTVVMAKAFPKSRFYGFDNHPPSIERAKEAARREGVADRVEFAVARADQFPGDNYGMVAFFDCLHDMGDPVAACRQAAKALSADGCAMIVEPMGGDKTEDNFNVVGRVFSGASVLCCTPNAVASGMHALGTIATDKALAEVVNAGGFTQFKRVFETPLNRVFQARV